MRFQTKLQFKISTIGRNSEQRVPPVFWFFILTSPGNSRSEFPENEHYNTVYLTLNLKLGAVLSPPIFALLREFFTQGLSGIALFYPTS